MAGITELKMLKEYDSIEACVAACFGSDIRINRRRYISGGDINESYCMDLSNGEKIFVKKNTIQNYSFFEAEEYGLRMIESLGTIRTPKLLGRGIDRGENTSFLVMEMVEASVRHKDFWEVFGQELAAMHRSDVKRFVSAGAFGLDRDNYIGAGKQINTPKDSWIDFFRECRLSVQLKRAEKYLDRNLLRLSGKLLERLEDRLVEPKNPSLLHGDLWSGNYIAGTDGKAWLIDPAVYLGHPEADLAMTELFGRFPADFYQTYEEENPLQEGYRDRRDLYNLYHLLNHLNLFGASYLSAVTTIIQRYA